MRASGMGVWTFLRILSIFVVAAWLLALANGLYIAPRSQAALGRLEDRLKGSQVSFEIQPRVFYEGFPKYVLYVQDVKSAQGAAVWKDVFMADISDAGNPKITSGQGRHHGQRGPGPPASASDRRVRPRNRSQRSESLSDFDLSADRYSHDLPSQPRIEPTNPCPLRVMDTGALLRQGAHSDAVSGQWYLIEFHRRFALPTACLVLALVGIPLGLSSKKSGKSGGFVLTILLVFTYYVISLVGVSLARQGRVSAWFGAWLADFVFLALGLFLLLRAEKRPLELASLRAAWKSKLRFAPVHLARQARCLSNAPPRGIACSAPVFPP